MNLARPIIFGSACSGIEAASVAWNPLGWQCAFVSEIEPFSCSVLSNRHPGVPNLGDFTTLNGEDYRGLLDVFVAGTPCQSFSVAGHRHGLKDHRGNLALVYARFVHASNVPVSIWENVPGVRSDKGNAFGCFLAALAGEDAPLFPPGGKWTDAGYVLGPERTVSWRILNAQYFGLAQRRKRVFVASCPRNGSDPRKILLEYEGVRRDFAPGREAGEAAAGNVKGSLGGSGSANCLAFISGQGSKAGSIAASETLSPTLRSDAGGNSVPCVLVNGRVRRFTPTECERLFGFPDGYTSIPNKHSDWQRYKALGKSMPVPVMRWIGERIERALSESACVERGGM